MPETLHNPENHQKEPRTSTVTIILGVIVLAAILLGLWFLFVPLQNKRATSTLSGVTHKMTPVEQEYVRNIRVEKIALSRAENFIHQQVTILNAEVANDGAKPVRALSLTAEFHDELDQLALRETRAVLGTPPATLAPGEIRPVEISFDNVPSSWNMQQPTIRVSYLRLEERK